MPLDITLSPIGSLVLGKVKCLHEYFPNLCDDCEVILNPDPGAPPEAKYQQIRTTNLSQEQRDFIYNDLLSKRNELVGYNNSSDVAEIDSELAKVSP